MASKLDIKKLSQMIRSKRGKIGLRETAKEIGEISASTLSRIELGKLPDVDSFLKICNWLNVTPEYFSINKPTTSGAQPIVAHLRADKNLSPETADALIRMI